MTEVILTVVGFFLYAIFVVEYDIAKHKKMFKNYKNMPKF